MNITNLFHTHFVERLLCNVKGESLAQSWTSEVLYTHIACLSAGLINLELKKGDHVLILSGNRAETYTFSLALWNIGAIAYPVNPFMGKKALEGVIVSLSPAACFYENRLDTELAEQLSLYCRTFIALDGNEQGPPPEHIAYSSLLEAGKPTEFGDFPPDHPALVIHSSGSQGTPKQIRLSHQNLFNYFHYHDLVHRQFADNPNLDEPQKPLISVFHPSHLAAYSIALQSFLMRRPTYLVPGFMPPAYLKLLSHLKCRVAVLVPSMYIKLLQEHAVLDEYDFSHLELCGSVGEPTPEALVQRIEQTFEARVFIGYGLTECLPGIAHTRKDLQDNAIARGSCGKQLFEEVKLVDESGREHNPGELWLRNPTVHRCYLDENLNEQKFTTEGWLKTGDLFYRDAAGNFFHKGRIDDMFVCNGKNIYPAEIEFALLRHPAIERAVAAPIEDHAGRLVPAALVQSTLPVEESGLIDFFLQMGPLHAMPKYVKTIARLPELGPSKVDRKACQAHLQAHYYQHRAYRSLV